MKMLNGRRPRRPDDNFYRESRRSARGGRRDGRERLGLATVLVVIVVVIALVAWWLLRSNP